MLPLQYTFVHLAKDYHLEVWTTKNGDLIFQTVIQGKAKGGAKAAVLAIRLKRV
jgi:hypothetical protein